MHMKRYTCAALAALLALSLLLAGCDRSVTGEGAGGEDGSDSRVGTVTIISNGMEITPPSYRVFELYESGDVDDLQAPVPEELSPQLPTIVMSDDFEVVVRGTSVEDPDFMLFNDSFEIDFATQDATEFGPGKHTVVMAVYWGKDATQYVGYWYYFNLEVPA